MTKETILAIVTAHFQNRSYAVGTLFTDWENPSGGEYYYATFSQQDQSDQRSFVREVPVKIAILKQIPKSIKIDVILINNCVYERSRSGQYGVGLYLYDYLLRKIPVIGLTKESCGGHRFIHKNTFDNGAVFYSSAVGVKSSWAAKKVALLPVDHDSVALLSELTDALQHYIEKENTDANQSICR